MSPDLGIGRSTMLPLAGGFGRSAESPQNTLGVPETLSNTESIPPSHGPFVLVGGAFDGSRNA